MPTGYTDGVGQGKVTTFREYALTCARAFGACVLMRDDPLDKEIPEEFKPDDYYVESLRKAREELDSFNKLSHEELAATIQREYESEVASWNERRRERDEVQKRYEMMLEKAKAFNPPTPEHREYAKFICEQLQESIKFDCTGSWFDNQPKRFAGSTEQFRVERKRQLVEEIERRQRSLQEEIDRAKNRTKWIADLRKAIDEVEEAFAIST